MICPRCNSNNPKDPMQCIRCGYIFPEYLKEHNIDITKDSKSKEAQKRADAIRNFTPKQNGLNPASPRYKELARKHNANIDSIPRPVGPTKIKMERIIGRNGMNRTKEVKECFQVFGVTLAIIAVAVLIIQNM